ncbi:MAG: monofunctional biosynthetic peptidoglycan transglycosylase [Bacteroidia bacterium]
MSVSKFSPRAILSFVWRLCWKFSLAFLILSILSVILFRWVPVPFTPLMLIRCVEQKSSGHPMKLHKTWMPLDKISPDLQLAVFCSEDQNFLLHHGFDFEAIDKAMDYNDTHKRKRGASTISQQTAKNVFLWPGRSWLRKGLEVYFTFLIEHIWSKERIMTVYLNVIEMGDGVYGAEAAAKENFGKSAAKLSKTEAAEIAATLPNPRLFHANRPDRFVSARSAWIIHQMALWGGVMDYHPETEDDKKK